MIERRCRIMKACIFSPVVCSLLDIVHPRYVNSRPELSLFPSTMIHSSRVLVELGCYSISVFLMLIFRPNLFDTLEKASTILCISSTEYATSALSSANNSSLISIRVVLVFALKCATLNRSELCLNYMQTPPPLSQKTSSRIVDRKMEKSVGTQPCLSPFVTLIYSQTSHPILTFAIIMIYRASIIVVNFSGHSHICIYTLANECVFMIIYTIT